jgi:50S ribosomal protein L16 3-hydroxylase
MTTTPSARLGLLGDRTPRAFLARHWQKDALLVRAALPGFAGLFTRDAIKALAARDDVESRLIVRDGRAYSLEHGPFRKADFRALPGRDWTLLVQGVNLHSDAADALLRRFAFLPYARLDDLMVSYAVPGGGVGPHFDSYDVFLLQGFGRRRWRWGRQDDLALRPGLPVKILRRFQPTEDAVLGPGDMLYLPASHTELAQGFLDHLRDRIDIAGRYEDPDAKPSREPARIATAMQRRATKVLSGIRWNREDVARFLGAMLSEPKHDVYFEPPPSPLSARAFAASARRRGVHLDRRTQWLYDDGAIYVNGDARPWPAGDRAALAELANARALAGKRVAALPPDGIAYLHEAYRNGYVHLG